MLALPDRLVRALLDAVPARELAPPRPKPAPVFDEKAALAQTSISIDVMANMILSGLAGHDPSYIRLAIGWPGECCRFEGPFDYIGYDGGGGIGSGPGMAVGAAMALRGSGRLPVAILGDGDYLMGLTALWTGVHHKVPLLVIVANNQSFFNDELHQERVARQRDRPVENRSIGLRMSDPPLDLAVLAQGQGAMGLGPVKTPADLKTTLAAAVDKVRAGATCVVDVHVAPEYARATSDALLRQIPSGR
jgi:thiamine pyrophosphate-dependent acetolactate synthase large subunit-like protein